MTKFTKERLEEIAELARKATYKPCAMHMTNLLAVCDSEVIEEMARQLLASMEQEPVAYMHHSGQVVTREECCDDKIFAICCKVETPLYAAPQLPQPEAEALKRLRSIVADPKTLPRRKEWISGQQYSYVLLESVEAMVDDACRAAMLQAGNHTEQHLDMVDHFVDANEKVDCRLPFAQWLSQQNEPIDVDCGCVTTEAFYHWLRVAYEAGNSPVATDGYVIVPIVPTEDMIINGFESVPNQHFSDEKEWEEYEALSGCRQAARRAELCWSAMIKAAPQQEVKTALEHGMQRYAGAMQKLSEGDK